MPAGSIHNMTQRHSEPLNLRISPSVRERLDGLADRYDQTITSVSRIALVIGLEALEGLAATVAEFPGDPGPLGPGKLRRPG